ncbi:toxin BrnT [Candidatus Termititenax aidoneus]|uniref:Toxin BrnT n=1 Tax=Termititenax aidoneus TaxID=2218524 RepID=A0A388TFV2_TERA1|nr:toxin BrnT [Candidatus Termititenax aidoneus]
MEIIWDENKNKLLKKTRGISFEEVEKILLAGQELDFIENPAHEGQAYYVVNLNDYIHIVPALINEAGQIVLKTIFPSRKYKKIYGGNLK